MIFPWFSHKKMVDLSIENFMGRPMGNWINGLNGLWRSIKVDHLITACEQKTPFSVKTQRWNPKHLPIVASEIPIFAGQITIFCKMNQGLLTSAAGVLYPPVFFKTPSFIQRCTNQKSMCWIHQLIDCINQLIFIQVHPLWYFMTCNMEFDKCWNILQLDLSQELGR